MPRFRHGHYVGDRASPTYVSWQNMRTRCMNPNDPTYPRYGGAGVTICKRWGRFSAFLADMGERPDGATLDRIDGRKGYSKSNCRWATRQEQARNRYTSVLVSDGADTICVAELARRRGAPATVSTIYRRLRAGWSVDDAVSAPPHPSLTAFGRTQSLSAWAREVGVSRGAIRARLSRGLSAEAALQPSGVPR
jgi:hypothetical protein